MKALKLSSSLLVCVGFLVFPALLNADDGIDGQTPLRALSKAMKKNKAMEGYHYSMQSEAFQGQTFALAGVIRNPDFLSGTGTVELFKKGKKTAVKELQTGEWKRERELEGVERIVAALAIHPNEVFADIKKYVDGKHVSYHAEGNASIEELECARVLCPMAARGVRKLAERFMEAAPEEQKRFYSPSMITDESTLVYTLWIGVEDLLIHRLEIELDVELDTQGMGMGGMGAAGGTQQVATTATFDFSRFNEDLEVELPREVRKMGIK